MSKQHKSKFAKAESLKPAKPFGGVVLEVSGPLSRLTDAQGDTTKLTVGSVSIPDAKKRLPQISCNGDGSIRIPLVGKATRQQREARLLAVKHFMASIPGVRHSFAPGGISWDVSKWRQETKLPFPLTMQEAAALAEKIGYMLATDFVKAGYTMDAAVTVLGKEISRQRETRKDAAGGGSESEIAMSTKKARPKRKFSRNVAESTAKQAQDFLDKKRPALKEKNPLPRKVLHTAIAASGMKVKAFASWNRAMRAAKEYGFTKL